MTGTSSPGRAARCGGPVPPTVLVHRRDGVRGSAQAVGLALLRGRRTRSEDASSTASARCWRMRISVEPRGWWSGWAARRRTTAAGVWSRRFRARRDAWPGGRTAQSSTRRRRLTSTIRCSGRDGAAAVFGPQKGADPGGGGPTGGPTAGLGGRDAAGTRRRRRRRGGRRARAAYAAGRDAARSGCESGGRGDRAARSGCGRGPGRHRRGDVSTRPSLRGKVVGAELPGQPRERALPCVVVAGQVRSAGASCRDGIDETLFDLELAGSAERAASRAGGWLATLPQSDGRSWGPHADLDLRTPKREPCAHVHDGVVGMSEFPPMSPTMEKSFEGSAHQMSVDTSETAIAPAVDDDRPRPPV